MTKDITLRHAALAVVLALAVAGCGDKGEKKAEGQAAARINDNTISVEQVNSHLARLGNLKPEQAKSAGNQVVRALVEQRLLMDKAVEQKLDRDPQVIQLLENARERILAEAYSERLVKDLPKPTEADVATYYNQHPELFLHRKVYRINELMVGARPEQVQTVRDQLASSKTSQDFTGWLKSQNIPFRTATGIKKAEELPIEMLPRLTAMQVGEATIMSAGGNLVVLHVAGTQDQPVTLEQAKSAIERFLINKRKGEALAAEVKKLKGAAKVEYLGAFADAGKEAPAPEAAAPAAPGAGSGAPGFVNQGPGLK